eukprot:gene386-1020_t
MAAKNKGLEKVEAKHTKIVLSKLVESPKGEESKKTIGIKLNIGSKRKQDILDKELDKPKEKSKKEDELKNSISHRSIGISMALSSKVEKDKVKNESSLQKKKGTVAKAFADDSESEEEEMPKEARMRMRNIGRETPTSAGPNSYNKGKKGFMNRNRIWEKDLKPRIHLEKPPEDN